MGFYTLQQTINYSQTFIQYSPLTAGIGQEPATTIANTVRNTIMNSPATWPWNRAEYTAPALTAGTQDYTFPITDFGYLEKITLTNTDGYQFELKNIHNTYILAPSTEQSQPEAACVKFVNYGTNVAIRFMATPDQVYQCVVTYQKLVNSLGPYLIFSVGAPSAGISIYTGTFNPATFVTGQAANIQGFVTPGNNGSFPIATCTTTTLSLANPGATPETNSSNTASAVSNYWNPLPDSFQDIFNNLFLAEAFAASDDSRSQLYRQRGVAAFLSKSEGLSELQINAFLRQWDATTTGQMLAAQMRTQQGSQGRAV